MPMKKSLLATLAALMSLQAAPALAENYEVNLTRKGSNVYKIDGKDIIIQTRYCYVYAYSEEAIFKTSGYGGEVIFFDSKDKCDVKAVFGLSKQKPGKYVVTVSHEDDDWYEVFGTNSYIKTSSCLSLALGEEAYLTDCAFRYSEGCGSKMATTAWSKASTPSCGYEMEMRSRGCC
jgi:hypothetical protein